MGKLLKLSNAMATAQGTAAIAQFAAGTIKIYGGTRPTDADTAVGAQPLLATVNLPASGSFSQSTPGIITTGALAAATVGAPASTGTAATWYRCFASNGTTILCDGNVGGSGDTVDLTLSTSGTTLSEGGTVTISSFSHTIPKV